MLQNGSKVRAARALIDTGSQRSYILQDTARILKYEPTHQEAVVHTLFGGNRTQEQIHQVYKIHVSSMDNHYQCNFDVLEQPVICGNIPRVPEGPWIQELRQSGILLADCPAANAPKAVELLIGADVAGRLLTGDCRTLSSGLVAVETHLGWTLMGKVPTITSKGSSLACSAISLLITESKVADLWKLDVIGIEDPIEVKTRRERDLEVNQHFVETVIVNSDNRYEVQLPWMQGHPSLPTAEGLAEKRLMATTTKLEAKGLYKEYDDVLNLWKERKIIEEVPSGERDRPSHYLPHHAVVKLSSATTRVRPVFDASARVGSSPSLNMCLETGPNLLEHVFPILLKFRKRRIGLIADIEKAFLQISISPEDRDFLRFLWWSSPEKKEVRVYRHTRVPFGVRCSPFLLNAVIQYHLRRAMDDTRFDCVVIKQMAESFYVDNVVLSVDNENQRQRVVKQATAVMADKGFNLCGWEATGDVRREDAKPSSVLGLLWNPEEDVIQVNLSWLPPNEPSTVTRRSILSAVHRVYDPIGLVSPITLRPKLLLQKASRSGVSWDSELDNETRDEYLCWFKELPSMKMLTFPRWIMLIEAKEKLQIHTFCDASNQAYAAVVYLRMELPQGVQVSFIASKARVAPLKGASTPRLELLATLIGVRLTLAIQEALNLRDVEVHFWSDSMIALAWIKHEGVWGPFVNNRVREIRALSDPHSWAHVPGDLNPADLPSRGCSLKRLIEKNWWKGPDWLAKTPDNWPVHDEARRSTTAPRIESSRHEKTTCA